MPNAIVTLPDGTRARVTFDSPEQLDKTVADLTQAHHEAGFGELDRRTGHVRGVNDVITEAVGEPALKAATGAVGAAAGGVIGLARGAGAAIGSLAQGEGAGKAIDAFTNEATDTIQGVSQALTREPRTKVGKAASGVVEWPFEKLAQGGDWAGQHTATATEKVLRAAGLDEATAKRAAAAAGAAVNTTVQAAPAILGKRLAKRTAPELSTEQTPPRPPPSELPGQPGPGPAAAAAPPADLTASPTGPRTPPTDVGAGAVPRETSPPAGTPPGAPGAAQAPPAAGAPPAPETPTTRAQAYASRIGLDWTRLGAGTRKALETIAQDASALDRLNPAAVRRQAALGELRVPVRATRGQLERDPVQLRREALASNTSEGQPIRDIDIAANRDLQANLEVLRGRVGGRRGTLEEPVSEEGVENPRSIRGATKSPTQVGESLQGAARERAKWSKKGYQALYKAARETEPDAQVPLKPIQELLTTNPEIQHLGWVQGWLNKARSVLPRDAEGNLPELTQAKLAELHDLRSQANDIARTGGKEGYYAGQVVKAIDATMEQAPEGAAAWKRANAAFREHQREFKDQGLVGKLVNQKKGGADRALALEKTWKTVAAGPLEQLRQVKKTLLTGGTPQLRTQGRAAWRDLRAETVNRILEDARNVTSADETERAILTEAALRRSINRIPRENLEELLGKANTRELYNILRARRITTRSPVGGRTTQSGTVPNALVLFEKVLKHIPGGKYVVGAKNLAQDLGERGAAARAAKEAPITPLEQAARDVEQRGFAQARRRQFEDLERAGPTLPAAAPQPPAAAQPPAAPTIGDALNRRPPAP